MENLETFKKNYLCAGLNDEAVAEIAALAEIINGRLNEKIITKGDKSSDLFIILQGTVNVLTKAGDKIGSAGPGSVLGEVALVDDHPRSADAVCITAVKYARLPAKELRRYMTQKKEHGFIMLSNLSRVLSMRLRNSDQVMEDLRAKTEDPWKFAQD